MNQQNDITAPVDAQFAAYNARDIEAFVASYAADVHLATFPGASYCEGRQALRERYASLFERNPALRAELINRMVVPPYVTDHERVTGLVGRAPLEALAIYELRNGLIQSVWFIQREG